MMMKRAMIKTYIKDLRGVAAVEFALIAPMLLLIMLGIYDYGMYLNNVMKLENMSRAAAQYVLQGGDDADIATDIIADGGMDPALVGSVIVDVDFTYECDDGAEVSEDFDCGVNDYLRTYVNVTLSMTYDPVITFPGLVGPTELASNVRLQSN